MSEANNNAFSFDSESNVEFSYLQKNEQIERKNKPVEAVGESSLEKNSLSSNDLSSPETISPQDDTQAKQTMSSGQTMNWQKVAHKLRDYNRKLLKKVFRLEQELAEIDNKFNKQLDKSRSGDLLIAQQAEEIKTYQEEIASFSQQTQKQISGSQQVIDNQKLIIDNLSQQYELSQQQTAQMERECTTLQERYNHKIHDLTIKEQEIKELKSKLTEQQRYTMQYKAEVKRHENLAVPAKSNYKKVASQTQNHFKNRSIEPWSTAATSEAKVSLPKTKSQPSRVSQPTPVSETVKTAATITTWKASKASRQETVKPKEEAKSSLHKKPQSLAAVDLPSFPRPQ